MYHGDQDGIVVAEGKVGAWLAEDAEYLPANPFAKLKRPKVAEPLIEVLSDDEIVALVQAVNPNTFIGARIYAILLLLLDTGIRASELCTLTLEHTDLEHGTIKVMGKGKKERAVPFCAATKRALARYVSTFRPDTTCPNLFVNEDGEPLTYNALKLILLRLGRKANVPRLHPHLLRHTFAVKYLMNGGDVMTLRLMLGHTTLQVTQLYLHLAEAHVQTQHAKFSPVERLGIGTGKRNGNGKQAERH